MESKMKGKNIERRKMHDWARVFTEALYLFVGYI